MACPICICFTFTFLIRSIGYFVQSCKYFLREYTKSSKIRSRGAVPPYSNDNININIIVLFFLHSSLYLLKYAGQHPIHVWNLGTILHKNIFHEIVHGTVHKASNMTQNFFTLKKLFYWPKQAYVSRRRNDTV